MKNISRAIILFAELNKKYLLKGKKTLCNKLKESVFKFNM